MAKLGDFSPLSVRLGLVALFAYTGINKIIAYAGTSGFMQQLGLPAWWAAVLLVLENVGWILLLLGVFSRIASIWLALIPFFGIFMVNIPNLPGTAIDLFKNIAIIGALVSIILGGPGKFSLGAKKKNKWLA